MGGGEGQWGVHCFTAGGASTVGEHTAEDRRSPGKTTETLGWNQMPELHSTCMINAQKLRGGVGGAVRRTEAAAQSSPFCSLHALLHPHHTWIAWPLLMTCTLAPSERMEPRSKMERDEGAI